VSYLRNIKRFSAAANIGGLITISVARKDDIATVPDVVGKALPGSITFKPGAGFVTWEVTTGSNRLKSDAKVSREGSIRSNVLTFRIPKKRLDLEAMFAQAEDDEFVVVYTDSNGTSWIFGLPTAPVRFTINDDSGELLEDLNSYSAQFYFDGPDNRYFYQGAVSTAPPSTASSTVQYSTGELIALLNPSDILVVSSDFAHSFTIVPGSFSGTPAIVRWDTGTIIASLQPGDTLIVDTDFTFDFEIIGDL
jgi:hypothetical protein